MRQLLLIAALAACGTHRDAPPPATIENQDRPPPACPAGVPETCALIGRQSCDVPLDDFTKVTCGDDGLIAAVQTRAEIYGRMPASLGPLHETDHLQIGWVGGLLIIRTIGCLECEAVWGTWEVVDPARMSDAAMLALQRTISLGDKPLHSLDDWRAALREPSGR